LLLKTEMVTKMREAKLPAHAGVEIFFTKTAFSLDSLCISNDVYECVKRGSIAVVVNKPKTSYSDIFVLVPGSGCILVQVKYSEMGKNLTAQDIRLELEKMGISVQKSTSNTQTAPPREVQKATHFKALQELLGVSALCVVPAFAALDFPPAFVQGCIGRSKSGGLSYAHSNVGHLHPFSSMLTGVAEEPAEVWVFKAGMRKQMKQ
jgi:hypothetical protein